MTGPLDQWGRWEPRETLVLLVCNDWSQGIRNCVYSNELRVVLCMTYIQVLCYMTVNGRLTERTGGARRGS